VKNEFNCWPVGGTDAGNDAGGTDAGTDAGNDAGGTDAGNDAGGTDAGTDAGGKETGGADTGGVTQAIMLTSSTTIPSVNSSKTYAPNVLSGSEIVKVLYNSCNQNNSRFG